MWSDFETKAKGFHCILEYNQFKNLEFENDNGFTLMRIDSVLLLLLLLCYTTKGPGLRLLNKKKVVPFTQMSFYMRGIFL